MLSSKNMNQEHSLFIFFPRVTTACETKGRPGNRLAALRFLEGYGSKDWRIGPVERKERKEA